MYSTRITLSAPAGIMAPVMILAHSPRARALAGASPAARVSRQAPVGTRVGGVDGEAVHGRLGERRRVLGGQHFLGQGTAQSLVQGHSLGAGLLEPQLLDHGQGFVRVQQRHRSSSGEVKVLWGLLSPFQCWEAGPFPGLPYR